MAGGAAWAVCAAGVGVCGGCTGRAPAAAGANAMNSVAMASDRVTDPP